MTSPVAAAAGAADPGEATTKPGNAPLRWIRRAGQPAGGPTRPVRWAAAARPHLPDTAVCIGYLLLAVWVTHGLWPDPASRVLALNPADQTLFEWFLANDARILSGDIGLRSDRLNAPDGVNLMANTSVIALGVLLAPVTVLFGAPTTFAVLTTGNLAGTAIAWYLLYRRTVSAYRLAATLGAGLAGFAPGMVSQSNAHLHITAQWLVPVTVWLVIRMVRAADPAARPSGIDRRRLITSAVGLALTVTAQVFYAEEVVFLTALTLAVMTGAQALVRWDFVRRVLPAFAAGLALATGLALMVLAYPLWFQFAGPQGVAHGLFSPDYFSADLASWPAFSPLSLAGTAEAARLTTGPAEYNTFLGAPLLIVAVALVIWLRRHPLVVTCAVAGLCLAALSLGPKVVITGERTSIPGPYALLTGLPVVDAALPMRFALPLVPLIATVLVLAVDRALTVPGRWPRRLVPAAVVVALLPLFPTPLPTEARPPVPRFISAGHWRSCVEPGGVLVPVPLPTPTQPWPMRWPAAANAEFGVPEGFFNASYGRNGGPSVGTYKQPTSALLAEVARTGSVPPIGETERRRAQRDIDFWGASCVALADDAPHVDSLRTTLEALLGPGERIADVWAWKVR